LFESPLKVAVIVTLPAVAPVTVKVHESSLEHGDEGKPERAPVPTCDKVIVSLTDTVPAKPVTVAVQVLVLAVISRVVRLQTTVVVVVAFVMVIVALYPVLAWLL
jgi:hypothetical protein